jgi:hypothetical protein
MQPLSILRCLTAGLIAFALLTYSSSAHALVNGWNLIRVLVCEGIQENGVDVLIIYPTGGGSPLTTSDPVTVAAGAQFCANGNAFYAYLQNGIWTAVILYPGFK